MEIHTIVQKEKKHDMYYPRVAKQMRMHTREETWRTYIPILMSQLLTATYLKNQELSEGISKSFVS
jgi:hypothetical protein